jgi:RHS repeat-associated protein
VAETNATGALTTRFRYEPFGQSLEANVAQGPGYTGHVVDAASGLIYMQQRYYDPVIGRFLSMDPDPVGELGLNFNRYAYVGNNPYRYVDPDGRDGACAFGPTG